jgi:predicted permease
MGWFSRSDKDYQEELREHIAMETQANIDRGMSAEEAARAACVSFGSVAGTRQRLQEGRSAYWWSTLAQDVRYGARMIRRNLLLSCAVVLTLSVGIGLTTAVFTVVNAFAFSPPVSVDPDSFVRVLNGNREGAKRNVASVPVYERLRTQVRSIRELAAWSGWFTLSAPLGPTDTRKVEGLLTSCNFFSVFSDEKPRLGRFLQENDCSMAVPVIVISERVWRDQFASDPEIIGKAMNYGGHPVTVVGVAVPPKLAEESAPGLWLPYTLQPNLREFGVLPNQDWLGNESFAWLQLAGRLQPSFTREAAAAELKVLMRRVPNGSKHEVEPRLTDGSVWKMAPDEVMGMFAIALAFPTLVMWIVCATVSTLLLSRAVGRQREMAVRLALGGGRRRLIQMLLAESFLLSLAAGLLSLVFVFKVPGVLFDFLAIANAPPVVVTPDWRVFSYLAVATTFAAVLSGLAPALESLNTQLGESLKGREIFGRRRGGSFMRNALVGVQVAFSMVLLVMAGALLRAEHRQSDPGFETRQVVFAELPQRLALNSETPSSLTTSVQSLPGIRSVAFSNSLPPFEGNVNLDIPGQSSQTFLSADVSSEYFQTFNIPVLSGRTFSGTDTPGETGEEPVVVSQRLGQRVFPQQSPLGKILHVSNNARRFRIIGVVRDRLASGTRQAGNDGSFVYQQMKPQSDGYLVVRFDGNATLFARALQSVLKARTGVVMSVSTIQSRLDARMAISRSVEMILLAMGLVGMTLTLVGVYGVVSFNAAQRKRDFAIRVALGASRESIFRTVVKAGMRPIPVAILAGVVLSFGTLKIVGAQGLWLNLVSQDPIPYFAAAIVLVLAVLAALALPAHRAMSSDPVHALREE